MGKPKPRNFPNKRKKVKFVFREYAGSAHSEEELRLHRGQLFFIAKKIRPLEVRALVAAFIHVESVRRAEEFSLK